MITAAWLKEVVEKSPGITVDGLVKVAECKEETERREKGVPVEPDKPKRRKCKESI